MSNRNFDDKAMEQQMAEYAKKQAESQLTDAISTMRRFCDDAEREANRVDTPVHDRIRHVMNAFAWGAANASTSLQNAISYNSEMIMAMMRAKEAK